MIPSVLFPLFLPILPLSSTILPHQSVSKEFRARLLRSRIPGLRPQRREFPLVNFCTAPLHVPTNHWHNPSEVSLQRRTRNSTVIYRCGADIERLGRRTTIEILPEDTLLEILTFIDWMP